MASICEAFEKLPSLATMQKLLSSLISKAIPLDPWVTRSARAAIFETKTGFLRISSLHNAVAEMEYLLNRLSDTE
jgi:hypothetical protein